MEQVIKFRLIYNKEVFAYERLTENGWQWMILKENNRYQEIWNKGTIIDSHKLIREQFTGLLDKHGKEIYCGDILKGVSYNTFSKGQSDNYEVIWGVDGWHIKGTYFSIQELRNYCNNDIEIIGNIHQNSK